MLRMTTNNGDTKKLNLSVSQEVYDEFNAFVREKHGKTRGMTRPELEQAMKRHMRVSELDKVFSELELIRADIEGLRSELLEE